MTCNLKEQEKCAYRHKEFNQNKIKQLNKKFDVETYHTELRGGKSFAAEKKI